MVVCVVVSTSRRVQISEADKRLKQPFQGVRPGQPAMSNELKRRLAIQRQWVPFGSTVPFVPPLPQVPEEDNADEAGQDEDRSKEAVQVPAKTELPEDIAPLFLWRPCVPS